MTVETKCFIGLDDILAIQFECTKCHLKVTRTPEQARKAITVCPGCNEMWLDADTMEQAMVTKLADTIARTAESIKGRKFHLTLEITAGGIEEAMKLLSVAQIGLDN